MQCSSPRANAGFKRLEASIAPSALPAPTSVCISSMNRMTPPSDAVTSLSTALRRSSNSPRYFAPAISAPMSSDEQLLVAQRFRHVAVDDAQRKAFDDRRLADAGLADQHRIVLGAARQHLDRAADLLVAADDRIELACARRLGEVAGVFLQRVIGVLRARRIRGAALAQVVDRGVERLGRDARVGQDLGRFGALLHRQREKQALDGDIGIAGLLRDFLGIVEQARRGGGEIELPRSRSLDFGKFGERQLDLLERVTRSSARPVDETGGQPFLVVQKHLEKVLGGELLMALAKRQRLRALHEAARPLGVFVQVHRLSPSALPLAPRSDAGQPIQSNCRGFAAWTSM